MSSDIVRSRMELMLEELPEFFEDGAEPDVDEILALFTRYDLDVVDTED